VTCTVTAGPPSLSPGATDVAALAARVRRCRQHLDRQAGRAQQVAKDGKAAEAESEALAARADLYAKTGALLTTIGEEKQESARALFEDLATRALRAIFDDGLSFRLLPGESGGQATLEPVIRSQYEGRVIETPVMDARGGGMAVVVGFILRLVMVKLTPGAQQILFLDETFAMVSEAYRAPLAGFLREVAAKAGVQIVMITHDPIYAQYADVTVRLALGSDGVTRVFADEVE
jgi:DNA repair exonuclease SbcCD ATPase subunit